MADGGVVEGMERRGRPRIERDPNSLVPVSIRLRGELFNRLSDAARHNSRTLGSEVAYRLALSFEHSVVPAADRDLMLALGALYKHGGVAALLRYVINDEGNPDEKERARRTWEAQRVVHTNPPRFGWLEPDKPRYRDEYDEEGNLVSQVDLDDEGNPIPATRRFK